MTVLGIPASLTNTTYTAPAGTFTLPAAKTACHGAVTVDLSACTLVDGGGTSGLLNAASDCTSLTVIGAGAPAGARGPSAPSTYTYTTTSGSTSVFITLADTAVVQVALTNLTTNGVINLIQGKGTDPTSKITARGLYCTGLAVGIEGYCSIDVDNCTLLGGGPNASPMGLHVYQFQGASPPSTRTAWVSGLTLSCTNSTVTGYVSNAGSGFLQGDSILCESDTQSVYIDNCNLGHNSDSGGLDCKANWAQISNCTIYSDGGRAISGHTNGDGTGPWNGVRSISNQIIVNAAVLADGTKCKALQAEGTLESFNDTVTMPAGAFLAQASFDDAPGSGAPSTYPRLGNITIHNIRNPSGVFLSGPLTFDKDATHSPVITIDNRTTVVATVKQVRVGVEPSQPPPPPPAVDILFGSSYQGNGTAGWQSMDTKLINAAGLTGYTHPPYVMRVRRNYDSNIPTDISNSSASANPNWGVVSHVSCKSGTATDMQNGLNDAAVIAFTKSCPTNIPTYYTWQHEPEQMPPATFRAGFARFAKLVVANRGNRPVYPAWVIQSETGRSQGGRNYQDWDMAGELAADSVASGQHPTLGPLALSEVVMMQDGYDLSNGGAGKTPGAIFDAGFAAAKANGWTRFGLGEVAVDTSGQFYTVAIARTFMTNLVTYCRGLGGMESVCYFNSSIGQNAPTAGWGMTDTQCLATWANACANG